MINGAHVIIYSRDAEADRVFLRDVLGFRHVDAGGGWLIFALPPAEVAVHPAEPVDPGPGPGAHELYLMCDDVETTVAELMAAGVEFTTGITDAGWGRLTRFRLPGGGEIALYEPRHTRAADLA
ncbi:VOC family protein [Streptomyces sp. NPDC090022]|uniref:VOC family protein n=1 Tax=Streptomyces sp. NPDC090022 TaxID=3365920 RepID=UPI003809B3BF